VFDASARERGQPSLNQCLEKGVNLIEIIPAILLRFRRHQIGIIADIRKAFLQINLCEGDRNFLRFLWVNKEGVLKIFRHAQLAFGVTSPFLLGAVTDFHLKKYSERSEETTEYTRSTTEKLRKSLYVDNCATSLENERELHLFIKEDSLVFSEAKFDLRGREYSDLSLEEHNSAVVLGLTWDGKVDTLDVSSLKTVKLEVCVCWLTKEETIILMKFFGLSRGLREHEAPNIVRNSIYMAVLL